MNFKNLRWAPVGAAFALFAAVDLLVLFLTPGPNRGIALLPPTLAGLVVLLTLPSLLALFDKQQESIEHQKRQLTTLHAMDTAIAAELELPSLLQVAAEKATQALDGEWGGIALVDERGQVEAEAFHNLSAEDAAAGRDLLRRGGGNDAWEVARVPVHRGEDFLGFLVVAKRRPGTTFSADAIALLRDLAGTIVVAVKNAHALAAARHLAEVERALARERRIAEALQEGLLPEMPEEDGPFLFSRLYQAQSDEAQVGGDIYDLFPLDGGGRWGVLIADVSGKGLKAAQKTALVKYALRSYAREHTSPAAVVTLLNDTLCDEPDMDGFVTLVYGVLTAEGRFTYASAGHETPILCREDGSIEMLKPTGLILGAVPEQSYGEAAVTLHSGDGLLLFTDGLSEARSPSGDFLDMEGLAPMVADCRRAGTGDFANALLERVSAFADGDLSDDVAMLWIERCPAREPALSTR